MPARPPTSVPLIRMNWRSRPTWSSIFRGGRLAVPSLDGVLDQVTDLAAIAVDDVADRTLDPVVDLALQLGIGADALTELSER